MKTATGRGSGRLLQLGILLFWSGLYVYFPVLPAYARFLGASLSQVGLIVGSYGLSQALLRIPLGLFADLRGVRKPIVLFGFAVSLLGALGLAFSRTSAGLFFFRSLTGVAASTWVALSVMLAGHYPPQRVVRATSLALFLTAGSQVLSTSAGGLLAEYGGWQAPFLASALVAVVGGMVMLRVAEPAAVARRWSVSLRQVVGYAKSRLLVRVSLASALVHYVSTATTGGFVPIYGLQLGASKSELGWLTTAVMVASAVSALGTGFVAERVGERCTLLVGVAVMVASTVAVPLCDTVGLLILMRALYGVGMGLVSPVLMGLSIKPVPEEGRAAAMGFYQAVYAVGMFAGPAVSGLLADWGGEAMVFWTAGLVGLGVGLLSLWATAAGGEPPGAQAVEPDPEKLT